MKVDVPGVLRELSRVVNRAAALREWQKLAAQERAAKPGHLFLIPDSDQQEIDTLCGSFMMLDLDLHEALARSDLECPPEERKRWQRRLGELERDLSMLAGLTAA